MPPQNHAALLPSLQSRPLLPSPYPYTPPHPSEVVIRTSALAINPADNAIQTLGLLVTSFPAVLGCDVSGTIVEVGSLAASQGWRVGDRVLGAATPLEMRDGRYHTGGFQEYVVLRLPLLARVPEGAGMADAAVLPLGVMTAASCLFMEGMLELALPPVEAGGVKRGEGKTLIVWAASSSVGVCGVQLAAAAGYYVIGVASARNHEMARSAGAGACFDQSDPEVVEKVVAHIARMGTEVVGAYDGISTEATIPPLCEILHRCGGRKFIACVFFEPERFVKHGLVAKMNMSYAIDKSEVGVKVWAWVERALKDGELKCLPPKEVVGKGLGDVQKAMDRLAEGVSGRKIVVEL